MPYEKLNRRPILSPLGITHVLLYILLAAMLWAMPLLAYRWVHLLLLSAVLLWVPLALHWLVHKHYLPEQLIKFILPAGLLFGLSLFINAPLYSGLLVLPWAILAIACAGIFAFRRKPLYFHSIMVLAAFAFWVVAVAWAFAYQIGYRPFNFSPVIVLLTAAHFHFAGFLLALLTAFLLRQAECAPLVLFSAVLVLVAMPLTAAGILHTHTGGHPFLETIAGTIMAMGAIGISIAFIFSASRAESRTVFYLRRVGGVLLSMGMVLAILFAMRPYFPIAWLDIPFMYYTHGSLNMAGLASLLLSIVQSD